MRHGRGCDGFYDHAFIAISAPHSGGVMKYQLAEPDLPISEKACGWEVDKLSMDKWTGTTTPSSFFIWKMCGLDYFFLP